MTTPSADGAAAPLDDEQPIGFGIVGVGTVARYHAQAIAQTPGARLVAVCRADADPERIVEAEAQFGVPCDTTLDALLQRPEVAAVCICTPSGLHAGQTVLAARAGRHALVEKPLALTLAGADAMIAACREAGVLLGVALQRRTDPAFVAAQAAIAAGALGRLVLGGVTVPYLRTQAYYESAGWRGTWAQDGGGALMNQGIHLLDLLLWLMGERAGLVVEAQAQMATLAHAIEVEDCVTATLRFANGALGSLAATTDAAPGYPHRVEVYGERGGLQIEGERIARWSAPEPPPPEVAASLRAATHDRGGAGVGASPTGIQVDGHRRLIEDFVAAIRSGGSPRVPGEEGRRSLAVALAIYAAARTGTTAVPG